MHPNTNSRLNDDKNNLYENLGRLFLLGTVEWVVGTVVPTRDGCSDLGRLCLLGTVVLELTLNGNSSYGKENLSAAGHVGTQTLKFWKRIYLRKFWPEMENWPLKLEIIVILSFFGNTQKNSLRMVTMKI